MPAYVKSVRYSETPTSILLQNAQQERQQQLLMQKAAMEDDKARRAIPMGLANQLKNMDADVINNELAGNVRELAAMVRDRSIPTSDLMGDAARRLADISAKSQAVKQFKAQVQASLKDIDKKFAVDKGRMNDAAAAFLAANIGDVQRLGSGFDFVEKALQSPELFVDRRAGTNVLQGIVKSAPKFSIENVVTSDPTGTKKLVSGAEAKMPAWYRVKETKDPRTGLPSFRPELKLSADGAIDETVFNQFYNYAEGADDFRTKMTIDAGAADVIRESNKGKNPGDPGYLDPNDAGTMMLAKRKYLTDFLRAMSAPDLSLTSTVDAAAPKKSKGGGPTNVSLERYDRMVAIANNAKDKGTVQLNQMEAGDQKYVLDLMSTTLGRKTNVSEFDVRLKSDGSFGVFASKDLTDADGNDMFAAGQQISTLTKDQVVGAEAKQLGGVKLAREMATKKTGPSAPTKGMSIAEQMRAAAKKK